MRKRKIQDLIFIFKYVSMSCYVDEDVYDNIDVEKINSILSQITETMYIDKSYVDFEDNKHEKTFMTLNGWNELCRMVTMTNYGKNCTHQQYNLLFESYRSMILCYVYQFFEDLGYDIEGLYFSIKNDKFIVEFEIDSTHAWRTYPGKWQKSEKYGKIQSNK